MSTSGRKVIILLGTFNGAQFLPEQLQSFSDQSHANWELLVSDDGSTDKTIEIIDAFAKRISQKVTLRHGSRQKYWNNFLSMTQLDNLDGDFFCLQRSR